MAYKSFIPITPSARTAGVGFLPSPRLRAAITITEPNGTTVVPSSVFLEGIFNKGDIVTVNWQTSEGGLQNSILNIDDNRLTAEDVAVLLAVVISAQFPANGNATANGAFVEILAIGAATTTTINAASIS